MGHYGRGNFRAARTWNVARRLIAQNALLNGLAHLSAAWPTVAHPFAAAARQTARRPLGPVAQAVVRPRYVVGVAISIRFLVVFGVIIVVAVVAVLMGSMFWDGLGVIIVRIAVGGRTQSRDTKAI